MCVCVMKLQLGRGEGGGEEAGGGGERLEI